MNEYGDWKEQTSSAGKTYYYNVRTESSQWDKPKEWLDYERRRSKYLSDKYYREKYEASYEKYATNYPKSYSHSNDARPGQTHNNNKDYPSRHKDYGNKDYKEYSSKEYKEYKEYKDGYKEYKDSYKDSYNPSVRHHRSPSYSSRRRDTDKRYDEEAKSRSFYDEDGKSRSFYRRSFEDDKRFYNDEDNSNSNSNNSNSNNNNTTTNTTTTNNKRFYRRSDEDERRLSSERSVKRPRSERFYGKKSDTPGSPLKPTDSQCNIMNNSFNPRHMDSDTKKRDMKLSSNSDSINYHPQSLANSNQQNSHSHSNSHTNSHSHSSSAMNQSGNVSGNVSYQMKEDQLSALMSLLSPEQKKILLQQLKHHGINLNTNNYDEVQAFLKSFAAKLNPSMLVSVTNMNGSSNSSFNNSNNANNSNSNGNNNVINNNASKPAQSKSSLHHQQPQQQQQQQHSSSSLSPNDVSPDQNHSVCNNVNVVKQNSLARNGLNYRNNADGIRQDLDQMSKNMIQSPTSTAAAANANVNVSANSMANAINANASGLANSLANDCATGKSLLLHRSDSNSLAANSISSAIGNVTSQNKNAMSSLNRFKHLFREDLIQHITNWPSDQLEEQAWLHFEQVAQLGNRLGKVSVELKKARSKVRLNEVEITLHKQRIQFANQQIKQLEEDQVSFA